MELNEAIKTIIEDASKHTPFNYELCDAGLFFMEPGESSDDPPTPVRVSSPIWVSALSVSERGKWGRVAEFIDHDGRLRRHEFPASRLQDSAKKLAGELMDAGLHIAPGKAVLLLVYLTKSHPNVRLREAPERSEREQIVEDVREFIIKHSDKFQQEDTRFQVRDRAGFYSGGVWQFTKSTLACVSHGRTAAQVAKALFAAGFLHKNELDRLTKKIVTNEGRPRLYCISGDILTHDTTPRIEEPATPEPVYETTAEAAAVDDVFSEVEHDFIRSIRDFNQHDEGHDESENTGEGDPLDKLLSLRGLG